MTRRFPNRGFRLPECVDDAGTQFGGRGVTRRAGSDRGVQFVVLLMNHLAYPLVLFAERRTQEGARARQP